MLSSKLWLRFECLTSFRLLRQAWRYLLRRHIKRIILSAQNCRVLCTMWPLSICLLCNLWEGDQSVDRSSRGGSYDGKRGSVHDALRRNHRSSIISRGGGVAALAWAHRRVTEWGVQSSLVKTSGERGIDMNQCCSFTKFCFKVYVHGEVTVTILGK